MMTYICQRKLLRVDFSLYKDHRGGAISHIQHLDQITMASGSPLTTHILDTARGCPASGVPICLYRKQSDGWHLLAKGATNNDGRCPGLLTQDQFIKGMYKMYFDTATYHGSLNIKGFYPYVEVVFVIEDPQQHYHVPLLLSPYGYSTYRGS